MPTYWPMQKFLLKFNIIPILIHFVIKDRFGYQSPEIIFPNFFATGPFYSVRRRRTIDRKIQRLGTDFLKSHDITVVLAVYIQYVIRFPFG